MTAQTQASGPRPGDQLGEFRILHLIGEGAMGKVYEARQLSLQRRVALKVLPVEVRGGDNQAVTRFYREARAAAQLHHPNIIPVYDFGFEQGFYYYAMQFVAGESLHDLIHNAKPGTPPLEERQIATWVLNVARGLHAAHTEGVIHRDIKPANIMIREDGEATIADFGLSRHEKRSSITQSGALMGTPVYMAPEQARGEKVDATIDVYALGVTLYEALTGQVPFIESNLRELLIAITSRPPRPPSEMRPGLSPDLEAIALKALAKEPAERYATAQAMAEDLLRFLRAEVVDARGQEVGDLERIWLRLEKQPIVVGLLALNVLVVIGALLVNAWLLRSRPVERAQAKRAEAQAIVATPLGEWERAAAALETARAARDAVLRRPGRSDADPAVTRARLALIDAERKLVLDGVGDAPPPAEAGLALLHEALAIAPSDHGDATQSRALALRLALARLSAARRSGVAQRVASARRELARLGAETDPPASLVVETDPAGAQVLLSAVEVDPTTGLWKLGKAQALGAAPLERETLAAGDYVVELQAPGRVPTRFPVRVLPGAKVQVRLALPASSKVPSSFVYVPPSEFLAGGDPKAVRPLFPEPEPTWLGGFFISATEVTVRDYAEFLRSLPDVDRETHRPHRGAPTVTDGAVAAPEALLDHPVTGVRYASALEYCRWLSGKTQLRIRLPSGAEWEKAARGVTGRAFPWGERPTGGGTERISNLHRRDAADPPTAQVGSHRRDRSIYGVLDLGGNVSEWVDGAFGGSGYRVVRGGSFAAGPEITRSASREAIGPKGFAAVAHRVGFRVAFD